MKNLISEIQRRLNYEPKTGEFTWVAHNRCHPRLTGQRAGSTRVSKFGSRRFIKIDGKAYAAARLAFVLMEGRFPTVADHINGNTMDNRWANLRDLTIQENNWNVNLKRSKNSNLPLGVRKSSAAYQARIQVNGKTIYLGIFSTAEEAHSAYVEAKKRLHTSFSREYADS